VSIGAWLEGQYVHYRENLIHAVRKLFRAGLLSAVAQLRHDDGAGADGVLSRIRNAAGHRALRMLNQLGHDVGVQQVARRHAQNSTSSGAPNDRRRLGTIRSAARVCRAGRGVSLANRLHNQAIPFLYNVEVDELDQYPEIQVVLHYLEINRSRADSFQRRFLEEICSQPYSYFVVMEVVVGKGLSIRDLFLGREIYVHERQVSALCVMDQSSTPELSEWTATRSWSAAHLSKLRQITCTISPIRASSRCQRRCFSFVIWPDEVWCPVSGIRPGDASSYHLDVDTHAGSPCNPLVSGNQGCLQLTGQRDVAGIVRC